MTEFNYQKAYFTLAKPAFNNLLEEQKTAHAKLCSLVGGLKQDRLLNIPVSEEIKAILSEFTCSGIAEISMASNSVGHWKPSYTDQIFDNSKGESWKVSNVCDQILRQRMEKELPHNIQIHNGKFRVTFESIDCWLWEEFSLATEKNLDIFKNCNLAFNSEALHDSTKILKEICNDLWPDVENIQDSQDYLEWKIKAKEQQILKLKERQKKTLENMEKDIEHSKIKLSGFIWLVKNDIDIDNCIYYPHLNGFCFGWRTPLTEVEKKDLARILKTENFPFHVCDMK